MLCGGRENFDCGAGAVRSETLQFWCGETCDRMSRLWS